MPNYYSNATQLDSCFQLTTGMLKKYGYLKPNHWKFGTITWSRFGEKTGAISIEVNMYAKEPYCQLKYTCNDEPIEYKVYLVSVPSNLGFGKVWYFICPKTGKRCRNLYQVNRLFLHRDAFNNCMYASQMKSQFERNFEKQYGWMFKEDELHEQIYSKHFKKYYAGKPTKRYLKIQSKLRA